MSVKEDHKILHIKMLLRRLQGLFTTKCLKMNYSSVAEAVKLQEIAMEENCILVNENDEYLGPSSKRDCHLVSDGKIKLHRAFSVFLFNSNGDMLIQKRSSHKVKFCLFF